MARLFHCKGMSSTLDSYVGDYSTACAWGKGAQFSSALYIFLSERRCTLELYFRWHNRLLLYSRIHCSNLSFALRCYCSMPSIKRSSYRSMWKSPSNSKSARIISLTASASKGISEYVSLSKGHIRQTFGVQWQSSLGEDSRDARVTGTTALGTRRCFEPSDPCS